MSTWVDDDIFSRGTLLPMPLLADMDIGARAVICQLNNELNNEVVCGRQLKKNISIKLQYCTSQITLVLGDK